MIKKIILSVITVAFGAFLVWFVYSSEQVEGGTRKFKLGLDLSGGTALLYEADVSALPEGEVGDSMNALRDVIERRINLFGVSEPVVQVQKSNVGDGAVHRLSIELPGVTNIDQAIALIGQTPFLEFKVQSDTPQNLAVDNNGDVSFDQNQSFVPTELTGKYLQRAQLQFDPTTAEPYISLVFNKEGSALFEEITKQNIGKVLAIYLDGQPISAPIVREAITGGEAQISGEFTPQEARILVGRLNSGALPVPISLLSTQTIGASLGGEAVDAGVRAAIIGFIIIAIFLLIWYRLPGLVGVISLAIYAAMTLALYKVIPVTITAAGIAGFIISIGLAVDANILIFERFRDERKKGGDLDDSLSNGYDRAWHSIRDANVATLITSLILFWFGSSLIKGFALTLGLGVIVGLFSALTVSRILLQVLPKSNTGAFSRFLFSSGFKK